MSARGAGGSTTRSRMTSEEREVVKAQEEVADFMDMKAKWQNFYERMIKPYSTIPHQEYIVNKQNWQKKVLTTMKPFNFNQSDRQSVRH